MSKPRKRRVKAYVRRAVRTPMIVGAQLVIGPLEAIIDQIARDGTVNADAKGVPIFQDGDGTWYETAPALEGVIWHLEMHATRHKLALPIQPLRELYVCLDYVSPISASLLARLQKALPILQRAIATGKPDDQVDLYQQARIKEAFELQEKNA